MKSSIINFLFGLSFMMVLCNPNTGRVVDFEITNHQRVNKARAEQFLKTQNWDLVDNVRGVGINEKGFHIWELSWNS